MIVRSERWCRWPARSGARAGDGVERHRRRVAVDLEVVDLGDGERVVNIAVTNSASQPAVLWVGGDGLAAALRVEVDGNTTDTVVAPVREGRVEVRENGPSGDVMMVEWVVDERSVADGQV